MTLLSSFCFSSFIASCLTIVYSEMTRFIDTTRLVIGILLLFVVSVNGNPLGGGGDESLDSSIETPASDAAGQSEMIKFESNSDVSSSSTSWSSSELDIPVNMAIPSTGQSDDINALNHEGAFSPISSTLSLFSDDNSNALIPSVKESMESSSASSNVFIVNDSSDLQTGGGGGGSSQTEVIIIAVCVSVVSLTAVIVTILMTFLIRQRMRRKAYLRVKHASQTELAVHYVQNTPASVAARDAAMEQLFQSLASMNAEGQNHFHPDAAAAAAAYSSDDQCLSPTESVDASELIVGKNRSYSRSLPSLKNLNAHEEALNCNFANMSYEINSKTKGRSRSFTERAFTGLETPKGSKRTVRTHSEKAKNRLAVVTMLTAGKRFEKKTNRRSTPSFSRLAKFNILKGHPLKAKPNNNEVEIIIPRVIDTLDTKEEVCPELVQSKHCSTSLSDFELPTVSPILQDICPMLNALHANSTMSNNHDPEIEETEESNLIDKDIIRILGAEPDLVNCCSNGIKRGASHDEIRKDSLNSQNKLNQYKYEREEEEEVQSKDQPTIHYVMENGRRVNGSVNSLNLCKNGSVNSLKMTIA